MISVTHTPMNKINKLIISLVSVLSAFSFTACSSTPDAPYKPGDSPNGGASQQPEDSGTSEQTEGGTQEKISVAYTLPEGWKWLHKKQGMAILNQRPNDKDLPYVKLDVCQFKKGTQEDAKKVITDIHDQDKQECDANGESCLMQPVYKEMKIEGTTVYMDMSKGYNNMGTMSWGSVLSFEKNGYVACFSLNDQADLHSELLKNLVQTLTINGK
jgi:hypothetical protein